MKNIIFGLVILSIWSCKKDVAKEAVIINKELKSGTYRAVLKVKDQKELPFVFKVNASKDITIFNAEEKITVNDITVVE